MKRPAKGARAAELRELLKRHKVTQAQAAEMTGHSLRTVESWLADPAASSYRSMPERALRMFKLMLPGLLAERKA